MQITKGDAAVFVYTLAAIFTGVVVMERLAIQGTTSMLAASVGLSILWTIYFKFDMLGRIDRPEGDASELTSGPSDRPKNDGGN